jgi:hypothetical protein
MPVVTATGKAYTFADINPSSYHYSSNYFNSFFPFLNSETETTSITLDTSTWFFSAQPLVYSLNRSDEAMLPNWIEFSQPTGHMVLEPPALGSSEKVWFKFKAIDSHQGCA